MLGLLLISLSRLLNIIESWETCVNEATFLKSATDAAVNHISNFDTLVCKSRHCFRYGLIRASIFADLAGAVNDVARKHAVLVHFHAALVKDGREEAFANARLGFDNDELCVSAAECHAVNLRVFGDCELIALLEGHVVYSAHLLGETADGLNVVATCQIRDLTFF